MSDQLTPHEELVARLREGAWHEEIVGPPGTFTGPPVARRATFTPEQVARMLERIRHDMDWDSDYYDAVIQSALAAVRDD